MPICIAREDRRVHRVPYYPSALLVASTDTEVEAATAAVAPAAAPATTGAAVDEDEAASEG